MNRAETTKRLGEILIRTKLTGAGKYYSSEVSIDPWTDHGKRVDFMQFVPENQMSVSGIEKGIFICYEVKSCIEDVYSGNGLNFFGEKNYIITTVDCYKKILCDYHDWKFTRFLKEHYPESSDYYGILVAVPIGRTIEEEAILPTPIDKEGVEWELKTAMKCRSGPRKRSMAELLFCMLRSGK